MSYNAFRCPFFSLWAIQCSFNNISLGDACATEEYYEQYRGKGDEDVKISSDYPNHNGTDLIPSTSTDVGIIASATYTTVGYQTAIKDAFAAFKLITTEGGNQ